jgi:serine/threonine-protein kinase
MKGCQAKRRNSRVMVPARLRLSSLPEQVQGGQVTTAIDTYALGVLLYLVLVGQHPAGESTRSSAEPFKAIVDTQPTRPSDAVSSSALAQSTLADNAAKRSVTPDRLKRVLRGDLDNILAKALKKSPSERYSTMEAFAADLRCYLNHEPVSAQRESLTYLLGKLVRRHRLSVGAASITLLALLAGVVAAALQANGATAASGGGRATRSGTDLVGAQRGDLRFRRNDADRVSAAGSGDGIQQMLDRGVTFVDVVSAAA